MAGVPRCSQLLPSKGFKSAYCYHIHIAVLNPITYRFGLIVTLDMFSKVFPRCYITEMWPRMGPNDKEPRIVKTDGGIHITLSGMK